MLTLILNLQSKGKCVISYFGSDNVLVLSVDNKAKVPIGLTTVGSITEYKMSDGKSILSRSLKNE